MSNELLIYKEKLMDLDLNSGNWALYGTGKGAEIIYAALCELKGEYIIKYIIERDDSLKLGEEFHHLPIVKLSDICDCIDGIIIAAVASNKIITERILTSLTLLQLEKIRIIDIFSYNTAREKQEYVDYIEKSILRKSEEFVELTEPEQEYTHKDGDTRIIAWYLPQFHQLEINNRFHGQGFTEWANTSRTIPMFTGHYQPHIPYDVGYYDLLNIETIKRQIYLAKHYGIYGFCIHYYWFSGRKLMEKPLEMLLKHKELDMPFCLNWANENWTALWDGGNKDVMLELSFNENDDKRFMEDILPYMYDTRYIKIQGKPVLVIYRINIFKQDFAKKLLNSFRKTAKENGLPDLYIMVTTAFGFSDDAVEWGADAVVEYPPYGIYQYMESYKPEGYLNPYFTGKIFDTVSFMKEKKYMLQHNSKSYFRSALTSWDNTARKALSGGWIFYGFTPKTFKIWLKDIVAESKKVHSESENIVFVNSWNEWAEGSHLEPDMKYGYAYLQAVKKVLLGEDDI